MKIVHSAEKNHGRSVQGEFTFAARNMIVACWMIACIVFCYVLFAPPRLGAANNGDYIRLAGCTGIDGVERFTSDKYPYFYKLYEKWMWKPFDWRFLTLEKASMGNAFPILLIRAITNIVSDTAAVPFSTVYLAIVYAVMLAVACYLLIRFAVNILHEQSAWIIFAAMLMLFGSMHLAWLNSFYGEAMLFVGLLVLCGCILSAIYAPQYSLAGRCLSISAIFCSHLFLTAKPQGVVSFPLWTILLLSIMLYHNPLFENKKIKKSAVCCFLISILLFSVSGISCYRLYLWNAHYNEKDTLYSAVMDGILSLSDNPEATLQEMGLNPKLAQDKGKQAYGDKENMYLVPGTVKAEEELYSKIDTFGLLRYYLSQPVYFYQAMEITAQYAMEPPVSLFHYVNDDYNGTTGNFGRFTIWQNIRSFIVPHHFWQYIVIYAVLFSLCIWRFITNRGNVRNRFLIALYATILLTGIFQYPLPFIGNGHADTQKQLYLFMLTYDIAMLGGLGWALAAWNSHKISKTRTTHNKQATQP